MNVEIIFCNKYANEPHMMFFKQEKINSSMFLF